VVVKGWGVVHHSWPAAGASARGLDVTLFAEPRPEPPRRIVDALRQARLLVEAAAIVPKFSGMTATPSTDARHLWYCAVRGARRMVHAFVADAAARGAAARWSRRRRPSPPQIVVRDGRRARPSRRTWYGRPGRGSS